MRPLTLRGSSGQPSLDLQAVAVERDDGSTLKGYLRLSHVDSSGKEVTYLGAFDTARIVQMARHIMQREERRAAHPGADR
jgi:hypothetical protein